MRVLRVKHNSLGSKSVVGQVYRAKLLKDRRYKGYHETGSLSYQELEFNYFYKVLPNEDSTTG